MLTPVVAAGLPLNRFNYEHLDTSLRVASFLNLLTVVWSWGMRAGRWLYICDRKGRRGAGSIVLGQWCDTGVGISGVERVFNDVDVAKRWGSMQGGKSASGLRACGQQIA